MSRKSPLLSLAPLPIPFSASRSYSFGQLMGTWISHLSAKLVLENPDFYVITFFLLQYRNCKQAMRSIKSKTNMKPVYEKRGSLNKKGSMLLHPVLTDSIKDRHNLPRAGPDPVYLLM